MATNKTKTESPNISAKIKAAKKAGFILMIPFGGSTENKEGQWVIRIPDLRGLEALSPELASFLTTMDPEEVVTLDDPDLTTEVNEKLIVGFRQGFMSNKDVVDFVCPEGGTTLSEPQEWEAKIEEVAAGTPVPAPTSESVVVRAVPKIVPATIVEEQFSMKKMAPYVLTGAAGLIAGILAGVGLAKMQEKQ